MLGYIRLFALSSLAAVLIIALLVGLYFRLQMAEALAEATEGRALTLSEHYSSMVAAKRPEAFTASQGNFPLQRETEAFIKENGLTGLRLYRKDGVLLFTTEGSLPAAQFVSQTEQLSGKRKAVSTLETAERSLPSAAAPGNKTLRSFTALAAPASGYAEFFLDVDAPWMRITVLQWAASGSVVVVFSIMLWVLLIITRKAEIIIARQHEANMELAEAAASAQAENQAKSQFLANISHELRTPLNAIIGFSEIMKTDMADRFEGGKGQDYINDIHSSGVHLLSLINDILDFSKADAGKLELEITEVNVTKTMANSLRLVSPRAEAGNVALVNNLPKETMIFETDAKKFKQILLNLLSNAVKFTPAGGQVKVTAHHDTREDHYVFEISDTGIGMASKDIARAMAPFEQVDNALSRRYEGTGLGLPLTKKFVELMGGRFEMQSQPNVGTTVIFSLPVVFKPREGVVFRRVE